MVELQHYEANAGNHSSHNSLDSVTRPTTAMPTNTRLQVAVMPATDEVHMLQYRSWIYNFLTKTIS